jgi:hypothetical protein
MQDVVLAAWLAVLASGIYHGLNPAMGWPLAVAAGMFERSPRALASAFWSLSAGHLLAMLAVLLPFALLVAIARWQQPIRLVAAGVVLVFGLVRLLHPRHPRGLARIRPTQLGLWSFAIAVAHGAGLMLVPVFLGMCRPAEMDAGHLAAASLMRSNVAMALAVALAHSAAMMAAGGLCAWLTYRYVGLAAVPRTWWNTERLWALSLVAIGALSLALAL